MCDRAGAQTPGQFGGVEKTTSILYSRGENATRPAAAAFFLGRKVFRSHGLRKGKTTTPKTNGGFNWPNQRPANWKSRRVSR